MLNKKDWQKPGPIWEGGAIIYREEMPVTTRRARYLWTILAVFVALSVYASGPARAMAASPAERDTCGIIAFLTDWGTRDFYVGAAKGVAYSVFPEARLVDITHEIEPYNIMEGAVTLLLAAREFPSGTVFVAVVDPGVGTERRPIAVRTADGRFFIGPDNGIFTMVMQEFGVEEVRTITNRAFMRPGPTSYSFHGRDIFTPTASNLAAGRKFAEVGPVAAEVILLDIKAARVENGKAYGEIVLVDQYGNLQANIGRELLAELELNYGDIALVTVGGKTIPSKFVNTYGDVPEGDHLIFIASTDWVEISINMDDAKAAFGAQIGSPVMIEKAR